ncbi:MAG: pilus assembly PilX family protein [Bacillota bacterium]
MSFYNNDRGATMILVIGVMLILSIVSLSAMTLSSQNLKAATHAQKRDNALYVAESGINYTLYQLRDEKIVPDLRSYPDDSASITSPDGLLDSGESFEVWYESTGQPDEYMITSKGVHDGISRVVKVVTNHEPPQIFPEGSVYEGLVTVDPAGLYPMDNYEVIPITSVIESFPAMGSLPALNINNNDTYTITGTAYYDSITIGNGATLNINGGPVTVYVRNNLVMNPNSSLITQNGYVKIIVGGNFINDSAKIKIRQTTDIHITGYLSFKQSAYLYNHEGLEEPPAGTAHDVDFFVKGAQRFISGGNNYSLFMGQNGDVGQEPAVNLRIWMGTDYEQAVYIENRRKFIGGLYTPTGDVYIINSAEVNGAIVGATITGAVIEGKGQNVNYDENFDFFRPEWEQAKVWGLKSGTWSE